MTCKREYYKVVLLGDSMTGKTSLMKRYFLDQYNETEQAVSINFDLIEKKKGNEQKKLRVCILL